MLLKEVEIVNYRSIEKINMIAENDCKIFVGKSETGKSNILHALSTLDLNNKTNKEDIRADIGRDDPSYIKFLFNLEENEINEIVEIVEDIIYGLEKEDLFYFGKKNIPLSEYFDRDYFYTLQVKIDKRNVSSQEDEYLINDNYKLIEATKEKPIIIIDNSDNEEYILDCNTIVLSTAYAIKEEQDATFKELISTFIDKMLLYVSRQYVINNKMHVLFWDYDSKNILPPSVDIEGFINDPDICIPLKKIFELSGITDIAEEYNDRISRGSNGWQNLLDRVSEKITEYFRTVWKELSEGTSICLTESETKLKIAIKDTNNKYDMANRSDGYKRLVSFLLMISIDNQNRNLKNTLLLIDEPECKIDIPGQRYLKNELLNIGKNNYVFYSTHSPYMVDNNKTSRHYLVSKEKEITTVKIADEDDYHDCNALFDNLGTSVFENIGDFNLALEGWTDKQLLNTWISSSRAGKRKTLFEKIHICHIGGVKNAKSFASTWGMICRTNKFHILSDHDNMALNRRKEYNDCRLNDYGEWLTYKELADFDRIIETAEDFLLTQYIKDVCDEFSKARNITEINIDQLESTTISNIRAISTWLKANNYDGDDFDEAIQYIKNELYDNLNKNRITKDYENIVVGIENIFIKAEEPINEKVK